MADPQRTISGDSGATLSTLKSLWPYMWPDDRPDLKRRVLWATLFLVAAKLLTVGVPYFYKWATDALDGANSGVPTHGQTAGVDSVAATQASPALNRACAATMPAMVSG